ncbi:MAG: nucleotidyltransferase domain-containing protein [Spirochaetaceae bacterium]
MSNSDLIFDNLIKDFSSLEGIEAIMLGGSRANNTHDKLSDYDIYIYINRDIPIEQRKSITDKYLKYVELNNQYWETEDDGIFKDTNIPIDIIYRSLDWVQESLNGLLFNYKTSTGYTTCIWFNFISSIILFDKNGRAKEMQDNFNIPYPKQLKQSIINKNLPLLRELLPAYLSQIEKAIKRDDILSINHRLAEFFACYFDILFAINELPHPGEKRMNKYILENAKYIPENMEKDITDIIQKAVIMDKNVIEIINCFISKLEDLI